MEEDIQNQATKLIEQLKLIKEKFIENQKELELSIRIDAVLVMLKDILKNSKDEAEIRKAITLLIGELEKLIIPKS